MATIIRSKTSEDFVPVTGSHRLKAALQVLGEASVTTTSGEALSVREIDGQLVALDATDPLVSKLRENRKVNSRKSIAAKPPAPWYRRFDKR